MSATVVLDIGKTNAKLTLLSEGCALLAQERCANTIVDSGPYPHHDTERIWRWMLATLARFSRQATIGAIVPVTHGATAALIDHNGLVLPILDYESGLPALHGQHYDAMRPRFGETLSPNLPAGLNLGRQLVWLAAQFPEPFRRARHILMYPQYWAWRLCGVAASEVSSLGCHTDLWDPRQDTWSSLVRQMDWNDLFPPRRHAWEALGSLRPGVVAQTGLPSGCAVLCGVHDSNASLLRHLGASTEAATRTVLSTGTWVIVASFGTPLGRLREDADMLANVTVTGQLVACMRFMGGREFAALAGPAAAVCARADLERLIAGGTLALPSFAETGGPFVGRTGAIVGPAPASASERYALATLYCALMTDYCLGALEASGQIVVEGSFTANPFFAGVLAALREGQPVAVSDDASGTTCGACMLHHRGAAPALRVTDAAPIAPPGLFSYRQKWLALIQLAGSDRHH